MCNRNCVMIKHVARRIIVHSREETTLLSTAALPPPLFPSLSSILPLLPDIYSPLYWTKGKLSSEGHSNMLHTWRMGQECPPISSIGILTCHIASSLITPQMYICNTLYHDSSRGVLLFVSFHVSPRKFG